MRTLELLSLGIVAVFVAGCSQQPLPARSVRVEFLASKGIVVQEPVNELGDELHFRFGRCNAKFFYTGTSRDIPAISVYYDKAYSIKDFYGDPNIGNAAKDAQTMFCLQKDMPVPGESE